MKTQEIPGSSPRGTHPPLAPGLASARRTTRDESPCPPTRGTRPWHLFFAVLLAGTAACSESPTENGAVDPDADGAAALHVDAARGSDANAGTREAPFATIGAGIQRAATGQEIRVAGGSYPQAITLRSGVRIMGGYDGSSWQRTDAATFVGAGRVAVSGSNVSDVVLDGLIIQSADVSDAGVSSIALRLENSTGITIRSSRLLGGQGGNGTAGSDGDGGSVGSGGRAGQLPVACFPGVTRAGGAGGGSSFAPGGAGGIGSTVDGGNGERGGGENGGNGGSGGVRVGSAGAHGKHADPGAEGTRGENGRAGLSFGMVSGTAYQAANGDDGTAGSNGSGGGGGGGGAGAFGACGSSGGGGGAGGSGGRAGMAGTGGGGSFGLIVAGGAVSLDRVEIVTRDGGIGGAGGTGGPGGDGGSGGSGRRNDGVLGASGQGGNGGNGGTGGHGGGGGGGPSIGILEVGSPQVSLLAVNFTLGNGGSGGSSSGNPGQAGLRAERHSP
jgi:hypothetical protein